MTAKGKQSSEGILPSALDVESQEPSASIARIEQVKESTKTTSTVKETSSTDNHLTMAVAATDVAVVVESSQEQQTLPAQGQQEVATANSVKKCNLCCTCTLIFYLLFTVGSLFLTIWEPVIGVIVILSFHCMIMCVACASGKGGNSSSGGGGGDGGGWGGDGGGGGCGWK